MTGYATFQSFSDPALADDLAARLRFAGINAVIEESKPVLDAVIGGTWSDEPFQVRIPRADFRKAHAALEDHYRHQLDALPSDYYLFTFSDAELRDVVEKPDEWNPLDYLLAQKLLQERGVPLFAAQLSEQQTERSRELSKPMRLPTYAKLFLILVAIFWSLLALLLGLTFAGFRRTLPDGQRAAGYDATTRKFGISLALLAGVLFVVQLVFTIQGTYPFPLLWPMSPGWLQGFFDSLTRV